jgi:hypothetical protein
VIDKPHFRPMTPDEQALARALRRGAFMVRVEDRRFAQDMAHRADLAKPELSEAQAAHLRRLVKRYRKKVRPADVPESERHLLEEPKKGGKS